MSARRALVFAITLTVATGLAAAQDAWESHTRAGEYAFAVGDTDRAEAEFRTALEIAQRLPPPDRRLEASLGNLARLYEHDGRVIEALPMYQLWVAAAEFRLGEDHPGLLVPLLGVGRAALQAGDIPAAEDSLQRYREIAEATGAADPEERWLALAMLARMGTLQERHDEALALQRQAVAVLEEAHGPTGLERATAIESLAQMELRHGDPEAAEALLVRAAELRAEDEEGGSGAAMLTAAAETAVGAGAFAVGERLAERALAAAAEEGVDPLPARRALAEASWMQVRRGGDNLGDLYLGASPDPELDLAYDRLLAVHGAVEPGAQPAVASENLARLAQVAALRGEVEDSAHWQRLRVDALRGLTGVDSPAVIAAQENLIGLFTAAGRLDRAATANAWLLATVEEAWGESSPRLRPILERQLELLTELGLKKEAKAVKKRLKKL
ncbi:MAG TPA: tetratricopeptide repeat protein [Methylomirabilota bacterium]|nr:tetratricopeptide repeat protein [Methylomirabilota bacterium]